MANIENTAQRLLNFAKAAKNTASAQIPPMVSNPRPGPPKPVIDAVYEKCLAELTDGERDELVRLLDKMTRGLV